MPTRHQVPTIGTHVPAKSYLENLFATRFPGVRVIVDPKFLEHIMTALYFGNETDSNCWIFCPSERKSGGYSSAFDKLVTHRNSGRDTLERAKYVAKTGFGLCIDSSETPTKEGQETERNILLGATVIEGVDHWLSAEQEWEMNDGVVEKEIHLHARPVATEEWDEEDNLSIILPENY